MNKKGFKISRLHTVSLVGGLGLLAGATAAELGTGTYCAFCPVGFLQVSAAARSIPVHMLWGVIAALSLIFIMGKFFCAWLCPATFTKKLSGKEESTLNNLKTNNRQNTVSPANPSPAADLKAVSSKTGSKLKYLPFGILGLSVILSFIVQFPVFCLVCPIGIFFGFMFAVFRLFHLYDPSWNLLLFPAILMVEIILLRKWCTRICPVGAVFSLVRRIPFPAGLSPKIRLGVDKSTCLSAAGYNCSKCNSLCPAEIDIAKEDKTLVNDCMLCLKCRDNCPTHSIAVTNTNIHHTVYGQIKEADDAGKNTY